MKYIYTNIEFFKGIRKRKSRSNQVLIDLFLSSVFLLLICMTACSGDDTEVEVISEPEVVELEPVEEIEPEPEPTPEPVVETISLSTLESWGIEDGLLEIVNGNCNLPIFKKTRFPNSNVRMERVSNWMPVIGGGPYCLDDDLEGSRVDVYCVHDHNINQGRIYVCRPDYEAHCREIAERYDYIDACVIQGASGDDPNEPWNVASGFTNFHDNVFRRSGWYLNDRGRVKLNRNTRSFMMVKTHINAGGDVRVAKGKLYGAYNPCSQEYKDRKALYEACGGSFEPPVYQTCVDLILDPDADRQHEKQSPRSHQ